MRRFHKGPDNQLLQSIPESPLPSGIPSREGMERSEANDEGMVGYIVWIFILKSLRNQNHF
jgi:hypothetical protein